MDAIGGYFGLSLCKHSNELFSELIHLNTGRNAFEYILKVRGYKKVFIPYYTCDVLLEPLAKLQIEYEFYDVNNQLEAIFDLGSLKEKDGFLITNYFGLKTDYIKKMGTSVRNLIVDNAQALFSKPELNIDTFYSPRKFVGIPDGGLLSINTRIKEILELDKSCGRFSHLIKRIDYSAEEGYGDFKNNDEQLNNCPIKEMSKLTKSLMQSIDFEYVRDSRIRNFQLLHEFLQDKNELDINLKEGDVPMVYPLKIENAEMLKQKLLSQKIYCATYWPNVLEWCNEEKNAYKLTEQIIALPIDQRYGAKEMNNIIETISAALEHTD